MLSKEDILSISELFSLKNNNDTELEVRIGSFGKNFNSNLTHDQYDVFLDKLKIIDKKMVLERSIVFTNENGVRKIIILKDDNKSKSSHTEQKTKIKIHDMPNIGVRIALSREEKITTSNIQYNYLRYKQRKSFISGDKNWKYDITEIISSKIDNLANASKIIKDLLNNENENKYETNYNIEIELINQKITKDAFIDSLTLQLKNIRTEKEVNNNTLKHTVYSKMYNLIKASRWQKYSFRDFISQPITMQLKDIGTIETEEYATTEKADGQRHLLFVENNSGYLINNADDITSIKISSPFTNVIVDGELIDDKKNKLYAMFDIITFNNEDISNENLRHRYNKLEEFAKSAKSPLKLIVKEQLMVETNKPEDIYKLNKQILSKKVNYKTDGLILTPINQKYYNNTTFKWKPTHETTIDFLLKKLDTHKDTIEYNLYVGIKRGDFIKFNLRHTKEYPLLFPKIDKQNALYFPVLFDPPDLKKDDENLSIVCLPKSLDIPDDVIAELYYDIDNKDGQKSKSPWRFRNLREDKTAEYKKYNTIFGNTWNTAYTNLNAVMRPITKEIITGSADAPFFLPDADKDDIIRGMRKFHNHIKAVIYSDYVKGREWLLEVASGKLADMHRWINNGIKNVVALDVDVAAVEEGARRIEAKKREISADRFPNIYLGVGDGLDEWLPQIKETIQLDDVPRFDAIAIQFAIHFFLKDEASVDQLIANITANLKKNGIFIATALDGAAVKKLLDANDIKQGETLSLKKQFKGQNKTVFGIKRVSAIDELAETGQEISVYVDSIGTFHEEYMVNFEYLIEKFKKAKFKLVALEGFESFYNSKKYPMSESEMLYSFMGRVLVVKKN